MEEAPAEAAAVHGFGPGALGLEAMRRGRLPPRRPAPLLEAGTAQRRHIVPSVWCVCGCVCVVLDGWDDRDLVGTLEGFGFWRWRVRGAIIQSNVRGARSTHTT